MTAARQSKERGGFGRFGARRWEAFDNRITSYRVVSVHRWHRMAARVADRIEGGDYAMTGEGLS